jgi:hypothetical protein
VRSNEKLLERLAATTNGAILDDPGQVFARREHPARTPQDLWPTLLSLALLLFLGDIAVRRLMLEPAQVREWVGAVAAVLPRLRQRPAARAEEATTSRLLRVKEGVEATTRGGNWETRKPGNSETGKLGNPDAVSRSPSSPIPQFPNFPVSSQADDDEGGSTFARLKRAKQRAHDTERRDSE